VSADSRPHHALESAAAQDSPDTAAPLPPPSGPLDVSFPDHHLPVSGQIRLVLEECSRYAPWALHKGREDLLRLRSVRITRMYRELAEAGHAPPQVRDFSEKHGEILLRSWRTAGRAASTIRGDWSILRVWCRALGRPRELKPLRHYWPDAPKANTPPDPRAPALRRSDAQLLDVLAARADKTHFFIELVCRRMRLTLEEALALPLQAYKAIVDGQPTNCRKVDVAMAVSAHQVQDVAREVLVFLAPLQRESLMWTDVALPQALRRHENHLTYLRRQMRQGKLPEKISRAGGSQTRRLP